MNKYLITIENNECLLRFSDLNYNIMNSYKIYVWRFKMWMSPRFRKLWKWRRDANLSFMWRLERRFGETVNSANISLEEKVDLYTDCNRCHSPLPHCHCMCPYCGKRDGCECVLFDAVTGG